MNNLPSEKKLPAVSVVIPNYNHAEHLEETIQSFLNQTHRPSEIIVIDDASTDHSWKILERIGRDNQIVRTVRSEKNGGVNEALARGVALATAPFLVAASVDDIRLPTFLESSLEALSACPNAAFVFSDSAELIDATGEKRTYPNFADIAPGCMNPESFALAQRRRSFRISSNTTIFRRDLFLRVGGFHAEHQWHADWLTIMRLGVTYGVCYHPEVLSYFRVVEDSYSEISKNKKEDRDAVIVACLDSIYESGDADTIRRFRLAAAMPEHNIALLPKLVRSSSFRQHCTPTLLGWMVVRQFWNWMRPLASDGVRGFVRKLVNRR